MENQTAQLGTAAAEVPREADRVNRDGERDRLVRVAPSVPLSRRVGQWVKPPKWLGVPNWCRQVGGAVWIALAFSLVWVVSLSIVLKLLERSWDNSRSIHKGALLILLDRAVNSGVYLWVCLWGFVIIRLSPPRQTDGQARVTTADLQQLEAQLRTVNEELVRMNERLEAVQRNQNRLKAQVDQRRTTETAAE